MGGVAFYFRLITIAWVEWLSSPFNRYCVGGVAFFSVLSLLRGWRGFLLCLIATAWVEWLSSPFNRYYVSGVAFFSI